MLAALAALLWAPAADAHFGGAKRGFRSAVTKIAPSVSGLQAQVLDGDDRLHLVNDSGRTIVVYGYEGEPYLRFGPDGVYENRHSPAVYLNTTRYGRVELPAAADPKAAPSWHKLVLTQAWSWHDHRIHWMSPIDPPAVRRDKGDSHHIFDWKIPIRAGTERAAIDGRLDYVPKSGGGLFSGGMLVEILVIVVVAFVLAGAWRTARRE